jgi:hypothetical protein
MKDVSYAGRIEGGGFVEVKIRKKGFATALPQISWHPLPSPPPRGRGLR